MTCFSELLPARAAADPSCSCPPTSLLAHSKSYTENEGSMSSAASSRCAVVPSISAAPSRGAAACANEARAWDAANDRLFANRADEIRAFLAAHPRVEKYAILDDRADAADRELLAHFVRTEPSVGLTDADVAQAIALLR